MKRPNRSRGHRSLLDKLPDEVRKELARRCNSEETLAEIQRWLAERHGLKSSITSISNWWARRIAAGHVEGDASRAVSAAGFEIRIVAPGAKSITVRVRPSAPGADKEQRR